jgi:hypothetical protein
MATKKTATRKKAAVKKKAPAKKKYVCRTCGAVTTTKGHLCTPSAIIVELW